MVATSTRATLRYLDNLKVLLIAVIIAGHAVAGYADADFWPYAEMKEVELSALTPSSLRRHGPGGYARSRLLRLGVPFALYVLLIQPLVMYPVHPPGETPSSYWDEFTGAGDHTLDTGRAGESGQTPHLVGDGLLDADLGEVVVTRQHCHGEDSGGFATCAGGQPLHCGFHHA